LTEEPPHYFGKPPKSYDIALSFLAKLPRRTVELGRFGWATLSTWSAVGARLARLRLERLRLGRERNRLQHQLGGAAYSHDVRRMELLRAQLSDCIARRDGCSRRSRAAVGRARLRTKDERVAVAVTQVQEPRG
jgi:hypothetical protein